MHKLSVIILSYALDGSIYQMNCRCIDSLLKSESWHNNELEILLIESCLDNSYQYDKRVRVFIPNESFNFHRFFNIGLAETNGKYIAFCNNDIVFEKCWFSNICQIKKQNPEFMCFSPMDSNYPLMEELTRSNQSYYIGWDNKKHFAAWCFVWERKVFDVIGLFDEIFDFYSADDDELMTLRSHAIPNVLVTNSKVKHLSQIVTKKLGESKWHVIDKKRYPLSDKEIRRGLAWLWNDVRFYVAYRRMEQKWGNERTIRRINRFFNVFPFFRHRFFTRIMYAKMVNRILSIGL